MEDVLVDVVSATLEYVTTPHNVLTHIVSGALLVGLFSDGIGRKNLLLTAVGEELLILLLWLAIPNSWASILALSVCIGVYERILGPQVELKQNFSLFSGKTTVRYIWQLRFVFVAWWFAMIYMLRYTTGQNRRGLNSSSSAKCSAETAV